SAKPDMCSGPGSCRIGNGSIRPQVGYDVKREPQRVSATSSDTPPPCMCPPPAMKRPLSGILKSAVRKKVDPGRPMPGTLKTGAARQFTMSCQTGLSVVCGSHGKEGNVDGIESLVV